MRLIYEASIYMYRLERSDVENLGICIPSLFSIQPGHLVWFGVSVVDEDSLKRGHSKSGKACIIASTAAGLSSLIDNY